MAASVKALGGRTVAVYPRWQIVLWIVAWVTWVSTMPETGARWWSWAAAGGAELSSAMNQRTAQALRLLWRSWCPELTQAPD